MDESRWYPSLQTVFQFLLLKYQIVFNANEGEGFMTSMKVEGRRI